MAPRLWYYESPDGHYHVGDAERTLCGHDVTVGGWLRDGVLDPELAVGTYRDGACEECRRALPALLPE